MFDLLYSPIFEALSLQCHPHVRDISLCREVLWLTPTHPSNHQPCRPCVSLLVTDQVTALP